MTDNGLIQIFLPILEARLTAAGYTTAEITDKYPSDQQGISSNPTLYYAKLSSHPVGTAANEEYTEEITGDRIQATTQWTKAVFQIMASVTQNPANLSIPTASDLAEFARLVLMSQPTFVAFAAAGIQILNIEEVSNPYETGDHNQFTAFPAFTFTLCHEQTITTVVNEVDSIVPGIYPV